MQRPIVIDLGRYRTAQSICQTGQEHHHKHEDGNEEFNQDKLLGLVFNFIPCDFHIRSPYSTEVLEQGCWHLNILYHHTTSGGIIGGWCLVEYEGIGFVSQLLIINIYKKEICYRQTKKP